MTIAAPYYATSFLSVLDSIETCYGTLFTLREHAYMEQLRRLPLPSLCLYAQLASRKGPYFRISSLTAQECEPLCDTTASLRRAGLLHSCTAQALPYGCAPIWQCFPHFELRDAFQRLKMPRFATKAVFCDWLEAQEHEVSWLLEQHPLVCLPKDDLWAFFSFLHFGELRAALPGMAQAPGRVAEAPTPVCKVAFTTREEMDSCFKMARLLEEFQTLRDSMPATELVGWWHSQKIDRRALPGMAHARHDRLINRLGMLLEHQKLYAMAMSLYAVYPHMRREVQAPLLSYENRAKTTAWDVEEAYMARHIMLRLEQREAQN